MGCISQNHMIINVLKLKELFGDMKTTWNNEILYSL
jgi:hypothetical protein